MSKRPLTTHLLTLIMMVIMLAWGECAWAQTWSAPSTAPEAGATLVDNDDITVKTVFATTAENNYSHNYGDFNFDNCILVRVDAAPSTETPTGTNNATTTPLVVTVKNSGALTLYFRRQADGGSGTTYTAGNDKDVFIVDQTTPTTKLNGNISGGSATDNDYCKETFSLEAGHTYTVWARGTTIRLNGFNYVASAPKWNGFEFDFTGTGNANTIASAQSTSGNMSTVGISYDAEGNPKVDNENPLASFTTYYHGTTYGLQNPTVTFSVPGPVTITIGQTDYSGTAKIKNSLNNDVIELPLLNKTAKYITSNPVTNSVNYTGSAATITIEDAGYIPYIKVEPYEAPAVLPEYTVTYYDADGTSVLGTQKVTEGEKIGTLAYTASNVTVASGSHFRRWKDKDGKEVNANTVINSDLNVYACVTATEVASATMDYTYDFDQPYYDDEHEVVTATNYIKHSSHGWDFKPTASFAIQVAGPARVYVGLCQHAGETKFTLSGGGSFNEEFAATGTDKEIKEINYTGGAGTLTLTSDGQAYLHSVRVVGVEPAPEPGEGTDIFTMNCPTGDQTITKKTESQITPIIVDGGTAYVFNNKDSDQNMITSGGVNISGSSDSYLRIVLNNAIQEGDIITITGDKEGQLYISPSKPKDNILYNLSYTVTYSSNLKGATELYFWKKDVSTIKTVTITRPSKQGKHQVATVISPEGTGKITIDKDKTIFSTNTAIVLTAVPIPNYKFVNWTNSATGEVTENPYNYTTTGSDVTITANFQEETSYTTIWNFKTMAKANAIERAKGELASNGGTASGTLKIDATNGKFQLRGSDAQFNANTIVQVPVNAPGDLLTVNSSTNALTVAGVQALGSTTYYTVSPSDMATGYVDIVSTSGNYLYDITVKHNSPTDLANLTPEIKSDIASTECAVKDESVSLSFSVNNVNQFQWYENTSATNTGGTAINGATNSTYKPTQTSPTTKYYYCVATNSKNDGASPVASSAVTVTWAAVPTAVAPYDMKVENAAQLLYALKQASGSARYKIFLADGEYNLGDKTLNVVKSNVSLIGQSKTGVIIKNKPRKESINGTAVFLVTGSNVVMQDLTIQCVIEPSARTVNNEGGYDERGVCLQDEGSGNVYRNIRLLGRQDTYYSRLTAVKSYFENCEIHGTVDFICGDGDVWFEGCQLKIENVNGAAGAAYITAPATKSSNGYIFNNCTISNAEGADMAGKYYLGRAWQNTPICHFYHTTKEIAYAGAWGPDMTSVSKKTMEEHNEASSSTPAATIGESVTSAAPLAAPEPRLIANTLTWAPVANAIGYAIYRSGAFLKVTTDTSIEVEVPAGAKGIGGRPMTITEVASLYSVASISPAGVVSEARTAPISKEAPTITTDLKETYKTFVGIQTKLDFVAAGASEYQWYISDTNGEASTIAKEANKIDAATSNTYTYTPTVAGKYYLCCKTTNVYGHTFTRVTEVSVGEAPQDITLTWPMVDGSGNLYKSATSSVDGIVNLSDAVVDGTIVKWNESKQDYAYTDGGTGYYGQVTMISGPSSDNTTVNVNAYVKYSFEVKNGRTFILKGVSGLLGRNGTDAGCAQLVVKKGSDVLGQTSISQPNRAGKGQPSTTFSTSISDVTCVENDVIDLYVYWGGTGKDKSYGLKDITITGKYTKEIDTASPTIDTDVLATPYAGMPDSEVRITIAASHYTNIQWYKNTTDSNTGGTKVGDGKATLVYTPTSAEHGQTLYFYAVVSNDDALGTKEIKSSVATVNVGSRTECDLLEVVLTNGFDAFIKQTAQGNTVEGYYMAGTDKPIIKSYQVSPGATYSLNDNIVTVTAEDGTTSKNFTFSCEPVEPLTDNTLQTITADRPSWLKGGCFETGDKMTHEIYRNVEQADNKRITEGKNRVYLFLGPSQVVNIVSNNEACGKYTTDKAGTYAVNGGERKNITLPKANGLITIPCDEHGNVMIEIRNLDTSSSWGFNTVQLSNLITVTFNAGDGTVGSAPADVTVPSTNGRVAIPINSTLYKQGYTLTGWTDSNGTHYDLGKTYNFTENTELRAEWRKNIEDFTDYPSGKTITWKLCTKDGGPSIAFEAAHCFVQQERIIEETNDIALHVAKIKNRGDSWITGFDNEKFSTYLVNGSKISFDVYYKGSYTLKVDEEHKQTYDFAADGNNNHCEFTYTGESGWVEFVIYALKPDNSAMYNWFFKEFKTSYPSKGPSDLAVVGDGKITLDPSVAPNYTITANTDYTTTSTGAMHYSSSDESVVTVSDAGVITPVAGGDAVVTVRQEGDASHAVGTIRFDVHVKAAVTVKFIDEDGTEHSVQAYTGERLGNVVPSYGKSVTDGKRFHGWFTATDGTGDRASEVYVVRKATDFHAYIMDIPQVENGFVMVPTTAANNKLKGDALLNAIEYANELAAGGTRTKVFIPNGTYDLGTQVLSLVGSNVSLIGESMEGVIIQNSPLDEGLDNTATFKVTGDNVVMQNLTIKNSIEEELDGTQHPQGVCIEDAGAQNVYREVRLLGKQNTYYASSANVKSYFENSEIHGTVDIIGGDGDVWFEGCDIKIEPNNVAYIAAPATTTAKNGFIFNGCTISSASTSMAGKYYLGRGYKAGAKAAFHNTTKNIAYKETGWGKNIVSGGTFVETASAPTTGVSSVVTNYGNDNKLSAPTNVVLNTTDHILTWNKVETASAYIIYKDGNRIAMVAATGENTQSYVIQEGNRAKGIKSRSNTTAAALEGGYAVASVSPTGIIGDPRTQADIPAITKDLTAATVYVGKPQNFAIEALDATEYQWYKSATRGSHVVVAVDANKINGATTDSYSYTATAEGTEYLVCKAHNGQGDAYSTVVAVTAQNPVITQDLSAKYGAVKDQEKTLNIVAEGGATYQWYTCDDAEGTNPVAIDGATSSMLTKTWGEDAVGKSYYIFCKVNGVVNSAITTVTVAAKAGGGSKTQHVGQPITEFYDFATFVAGGTPNLTVSGDAIHQSGTKGRDVFKVDNPTAPSSGKTMELNGRLYVANDSKSGANQMRWMWRSSTTAYQNGMAGQWYGKGTTLPNNLTIVGLYAGDKVTITYAPRAGKDSNIRVCAAGQLTDVAADATISTTREYTVAADGQLDLYVNDNNMAIQSVKIVTEWYATSEPSVTRDLSNCNAYKDVPRVLTVAASNADSYQWYKNSTNSKDGATAIDGATTNTYVYTPESAGTEYFFCVARNENGSKASDVAAVTTTASETITLDFINRAEDDKTLAFGAQNGTAKNSAGSALAVYNVEQPYDMKGYLAVFLDAAMGGYVNSNGLTNANRSGDRPFKIPGLQTGDVVTFIGSGLFSGMGVHSSILATVSAKDDVVSIEMTNNGDLNVWMVRQNAAHIEQIVIKKKTTPAFTQNLNEKYFVTTGGDLTLNVTATNAGSYQWYRNTYNSNMGGELISGATTASYTPATSANGTHYYYCVATNTTTNTVAVSNVAQVDVANVVFRDFELDIRQKRDYGLTEAETAQGQTVDFGVLVDEDGTLTRVAETANVNVRVQGTYESTVLGLKNAVFTVPVQGKVKFSIGKTGEDANVTVTDAAGNTVATLNTKGGKWSSNKKNIAYGYYTGPSTTLTFTAASGKCVPYIRVEAVQVAELNAPAIRQTSFDVVKRQWAVTMATNADATGARIYYTTDGTDPTVGSTLYSGTAYIDPNTTIKAFAVCDGWYDSDISSLTTAAQPETKGTELISYNNGATGDNIGTTYTVAATYNAGKPAGEGDGLKMNLTSVNNEGDHPYTVNGFRINVNNGYRITGIDLNSVNFTYSKMYVDGVEYTGALNALNATQTIDFECTGSTPIDTKITLSYEFADEVTGITVNGVALTEGQVTAFKNKTLSIDTQYKGAPEVVVTTALGYSYPVTGTAGDGTNYTYSFDKVGDCQLTFTNVLKSLPVIAFNESKFYYANPDGEASRGKGYNFTVSGETGGTYTITIDGGAEQTYDSSKKYYAIETATVKYSNADASYPKDVVTANVESTDFNKKKPFAIYLYAGGYTDQNMEPKPLEAKMILDGIGETYNVVLTNKGDVQLTGEAGTKDLDNLGKADLIVLSEAMSSSEKIFQTFDYKNGTKPKESDCVKQLGLNTANVLNFKIFATKSSVWNWAEPAAVDTKNISIIPSNPLYSVFNGVSFNDDANHTIDLWNDSHAPLLNHLQGVWNYVEGSKGPEFFNLATAQSSATSTLDVLQYRYATPLANDATQVDPTNKVFVNFGLNINDYSAYDENVKTIVGNICRMINAGTPLNSIATKLTKPVITDNGDGSAKIMTSTSLATIKYVAYDAEQNPAPTAEYIKTNGVVAVKGMTKQFATDKYIYAVAVMDGMNDSEVSDGTLVNGSKIRKITRRSDPADGAIGEEVTLDVDATTEGLIVPYNQSFKKEGYTVTSWKDANSGTVYVPGTPLTLDQDLDLVAQWTKNTKKITDLKGAAGEQRTATFHFLHKDGAPWYKLESSGEKGVLVGQVRFADGDFIDVFLDIENRPDVVNPIDGVAYGGKFSNVQTNSVDWYSGDGTKTLEYCQVKTGTTFTFPAVYGMTVNFMPIDLEQDNLLNVHRSYVNSSTLTDGEIENPAYDLIAGNYVFARDNHAEGGNYNYHGDGLLAEFTVRESSMVYARTDVSQDKSLLFENEASFNQGSCFMQSISVTYPALYEVKPTLNPEKSVLVADGSMPTATLDFTPQPAGNTDGKFLDGTEVTMTVTPSYAYKFTGIKDIITGVTLYESGSTLPEDGGKYVFTINKADVAMTVNMQKLETYVITTGVYPIGTGRVDFDPNYTSFAEGHDVTLKAVPKMGYQFKHWSRHYSNTDLDKYDAATTDSYNLTVNSDVAKNEYYAVFEPGKEGTVHYKLDNAILLNEDGTTEKASYKMTDVEKAGFPTSITKTAMVIPMYYTMYKEGYTLDHWVECKSDGADVTTPTRYDIGTYYYFNTDNETRYIKPVFKKNKTDFDYRTTPVDITWDFRRAYYAQTMKVGANNTNKLADPNNTTSLGGYFHYSTHATINKETDATGVVTMDVPILINTGEKGQLDNTDHDEWTTIGEGTTITIPSGLGATFTLASYAPISTTTIDNDVLTNYTVIDDGGTNVYLYTYTTESAGTSVTLTIGDDYAYYKYLRAQLPAADRVGLNVSVNNAVRGSARLVSAGTVANGDDIEFNDLGGGNYSLPLGSVVTITAKRNRLYEFEGWVNENGEPLTGTGYDITTDVNSRTDEVTSTIIFTLSQYQTNVRAMFKEREQYQINYTAGSLATGIAPAVQVIEKGERFTLPSHNQVLYYEGHTLKYWEDEEGNRYDFGESYVPTGNLLLSPVFLPNEFAFSDILNDVTMTWPLAVAQGATDINFRGSSGIIVDQMEYEGMKIDMKLDIKSSSTSYRAYNNTNDNYCLITDGINIELPSTPGCKITLNSYEEKVTTTEIAGATSDKAGANTVDKYSAGVSPTVIIKQDNTQGAQTISFKGDSPSFTSISVTYTAITGVALPELTEVTIGGVAIGSGKYDRYSVVDLNSDKVLNSIPVEIVDDKMPEVKVTKTSNSKESNGVWSTSDEITYVQATIDNPTATIILKSAHGIIAGVYKLNFRAQKITGNPTLLNVNIFRQDRELVDGIYNAGTVAPNSIVTLTFDRVMAAKTVTAADIEVDPSQTGTFHGAISAPEGKDLKFSYWDLDLGKYYKFTVKAGTLKDIYGNPYNQPLTFQFTISTKLIQYPDNQPYDFVVTHRETFDHSLGRDKASQTTMAKTLVATPELIANLEKDNIPHGTIDEAIAAANASNAEGNRSFFRIFVPDGEYQIGGNAPINPGRDHSENKDTKVIAKASFPWNNGETFMTRPRTSVIGQSQDKTVIFSDPYIYGISYTSTIEVRPHATDCYFQDLTLDNRYSWHQMRAGTKPAGQSAAFYDRGQRTILKNVGVLGYQDSYVSDASNYAQGKSRCYYETCTFAGTVDFLCGDGDMWWEKCKLLMRYRASNNLIAPRQSPDTKWGYVMNNCIIDAEDETKTHAYQEVFGNSYDETYEINAGNYNLGRPWENSPAITWLNTQMILQPAPTGWMNMKDAGLVLRFQEYGTVDADGNPVDLSTRTTRLSTPGPGSYDVVMTAKNVERYNLHSVIGGDEGYDPTVYTAQQDSVKGLGFDDRELNWKANVDALCYCIFRSDTENGEYKLFAVTASNKYDCNNTEGWYMVRAANQRGGLGTPTKPILYTHADTYELALAVTRDQKTQQAANPGMGWSTICLPWNARVPSADKDGKPLPDGFRVYAVVKIENNVLTLRKVDYLTKDKGYVVFGPAPAVYEFRQSTHDAFYTPGYNYANDTYLSGNPTDEPISAYNVSCYTLAFKPNISGVGFYRYTGEFLNPHKAYLKAVDFLNLNASDEDGVTIESNAAKRGIIFRFEDGDDPVGIQDVVMPEYNVDIIYDLTGRRVNRASLREGNIYIINGKKMRYVK